MTALVLFLRSPLGRGLLTTVAAIAAFTLALGAIYNAGAEAARKPLVTDRDLWRTTAGQYLQAAKAWEAAYRQSEALRAQERAEAVGAINDAAKSCEARVARARRSAAALQSIITREPEYDASHCPVRRSVDDLQLRDALGLDPAR